MAALPGGYDYLREIALDYAFFLTHLGIGEMTGSRALTGKKRKGINTEAAEIAEDTEDTEDTEKSSPGMSEPTTPLMMQITPSRRATRTPCCSSALGDFYELFYEDAIIAARELPDHAHLAQPPKRASPFPCAAFRTTPPKATSRA